MTGAKRRRQIAKLFAFTVAALLHAPAYGDEVYDVIDLGTLGGSWSAAYGINDRGVVVGESADAAGQIHAFVWSNGVMTKLLGQPWITNSTAFAINEQGHIVGTANSTGAMIQGFYFAGSTYTSLGVMAGGNYSEARALNDHGQVVGQSHVTNAFGINPHAFRWTNGVMVDLGTLDGSGAYSSEAYGIDSAGRVVGVAFYYCPWNCWDPFIWVDANTNGVREFTEMIPLDGLSGDYGRARAINDIGQIVGEATTVGFSEYHAFLITPRNGQWNTDADYNTPNPYMVDLGTLGGTNSYAWGINDAGIVVGYSEIADGSAHAYLYEAGFMQDLNDLVAASPGRIIRVAHAINSSGHMAGYGSVSGQTHALLLVPASNRVTLTRAVPAVDALGNVSLYWSARGSNLGFTVETAADTTGGMWSVAVPTSQWPTTQLYWTNAPVSSLTSGLFRVRAESF